MKKPTLSIIGCGKIGLFLAKILLSHVELGSIYNKRRENAEKVVALLGAGHVVDAIEDVVSSDYYIIATPESFIAESAEKLTRAPIQKGQVVFHVSGAYPSSWLEPLSKKGLYTASFHPDISMPDPTYIPASCYATIEGDGEAKERIRKLFSFYPIVILDIKPEEKLLYHAALVMVSNFSVALIHLAETLLDKTNLEEGERMLSSLLDNTLMTIRNKGLMAALSGPVSRGASQLVAEQIKLLESINPRYGLIYKLMSQELLEMAETKLASTNVTQLKNILLC